MAFKKGQSGNPAGRPKGTTDKRIAYLRSNERRLQKKLVRMALNGDTRAMQLCADRLWPRLRPQAVAVNVRTESADLAGQGAAIIAAALSGQLTTDVLKDLLAALADQARLVEFTEIENRLQILEEHKETVPWEVKREMLPIRGKKRRKL